MRIVIAPVLALALAVVACSTAALTPSQATGEPPGSSSGTSGDDPGNGGDAGDGTSSSGSTTSSSGAPVVVQPDSVTVIVEPTDKAQALLTAIEGAKKSVHMTMYLIDDKRFITALINQHKAGLDVQVILNHDFPDGSGTNAAVFTQLQTAGVPIVWAPSTFTLTHEKCVLLDGTQAWIMTMNLEVTSPTANREFLAVDTQPDDIVEAETIFAADFGNKAVNPTGNLVVAPTNARDKLVSLIQSAKSTVDVEGEELSDTKIVDALVAAQKAGVTVRVVLADGTPTPSQTTAVTALKAGSVKVVSVSNPYIHAKAIAVDGTSAYVGSENFTTSSLQYNRELGLVTTNVASVTQVDTTIGQDFAIGKAL